MLLEVDNSTTHIEITPTFSSLDESLHLIKRYLMKQLSTQEEAWRLSPQAPVVVVDLGLLGISDFGKAAEVTPSWKDKITYPIRLYRSQVVLGPLFIPSQAASPCPHCLERRWFGNRPKAAQVAVMHAQQALISGHNPKVTPFALESIWNVIASTVFQPANILLSPHETYPFYVLNLESLQVAQYHLIQDPLCPICTTPILDTPEAAELQLSSRPKHHPSSYRLVKATDYDLPLSGLINPVSGVPQG